MRDCRRPVAIVDIISPLVVLAIPSTSAPGQPGALAAAYLGLRLTAAPLLLLACALREFRCAVGDTRSSMNGALVANVANLGLNAFLVFYL